MLAFVPALVSCSLAWVSQLQKDLSLDTGMPRTLRQARPLLGNAVSTIPTI